MKFSKRLGFGGGALLLLSYAWIYGLTAALPNAGPSLAQTARNLFFHVPMWFTMYTLMGISVFWAVRYLMLPTDTIDYLKAFTYDTRSAQAAITGVFFGGLGLVTGIFWSRVTWGEDLPDNDFSAWWPWDPKQTLALVALFIYVAYLLLRQSIPDFHQRARISAVYNLFAAASLIPLTFIIPRMLGGLHPGSDEATPLFKGQNIANEFRLIFYPAIIGNILLGLWFWLTRVKITLLFEKLKIKTHGTHRIISR